MTISFRTSIAGGLAALGFGLLASAASAQTVNIYSYRQPDLIKPVLDAFTAETGVKTEVLFLDKGLEERMAAEGENSPATSS
jgi:iron(III) transport system substrate-binding protein